MAAVVSFIDRINHGDVPRLSALMTDDHALRVLDEAPIVGREGNVEAWNGYTSGFPRYVIYPQVIAEPEDGVVSVLGTTTGSHLGLPDDEERKLTVIWRGVVTGGRLQRWQVLADTPTNRAAGGLPPTA